MLINDSHGANKFMASIKESRQVTTIRLRRCRCGSVESEPHGHQFMSIADVQAIHRSLAVGLTYRESEVSVGNDAKAGAVFSNHFTVSALCFILSTSPR